MACPVDLEICQTDQRMEGRVALRLCEYDGMEHGKGYDVIGDVHGEVESLIALLGKLGYEEGNGVWRHRERQAVFVGDLIDRGPGQVEVVRLVRAMAKAGAALVCMGNHEFNAIAWATEKAGEAGVFLRDHRSDNKRQQHQAFLDQVVENSPLHREIIEWFKTLPLVLDLTGLRVVHACWQKTLVDHLRRRTNGTLRLTPELLQSAHIKGSDDYHAIETVLKGIEVPLPDGLTFFDRSGYKRSEARIKWWAPEPRTYRNSALAEDLRDQLPESLLPVNEIEHDNDPRPVIFGHYWDRGALKLSSAKATCVDYSAALGGELVAYRWSGESVLDAANLVAVPGNRRPGFENEQPDE
jgi:Calcineurin-like phosphoesterase